MKIPWRVPDPDALPEPERPPGESTDYPALHHYLKFQQGYLKAWLKHRNPEASQREAIEQHLASIASTLHHHPLNADLQREIARVDEEIQRLREG